MEEDARKRIEFKKRNMNFKKLQVYFVALQELIIYFMKKVTPLESKKC